MRIPLLLTESHRDVRKMAALVGYQMETPRNLIKSSVLRKTTHVYKNVGPQKNKLLKKTPLKLPVLKKKFESGSDATAPLPGLHLNVATSGENALPTIRKRPPLERHRNSPDPNYMQEMLRRNRSDLHRTYASKVKPSDINQFSYNVESQQPAVTRSLELPSKPKLPDIEPKHNSLDRNKKKISLKLTNVDHEMPAVNNDTKHQDDLNSQENNQTKFTNDGLSNAEYDNMNGGWYDDDDDDIHNKLSANSYDYEDSKYFNLISRESENQDFMTSDIEDKGKENIEYIIKYKHGIIPRIKKRSKPPDGTSAEHDGINMLDKLETYNYLGSDRSLTLSFIDDLHKESDTKSGWAPDVCKECENENHEKWCSQYEGGDQNENGESGDLTLTEDGANLSPYPEIYDEGGDRMERLRQRHAKMAEKVLIANEERQPSNLFTFTRAGVNEEANKNPLFTDGPREAYLKALRAARTPRMPAEPWMMGSQTSRAFIFSYYEAVPRLPEARLPRKKIKNDMQHLMSGQDVNDYYPGGRKNPLDPIMYKAFLDIVNSKQKVPKRKTKKKAEKQTDLTEKPKKKESSMTLQVEHSVSRLPSM